MIRRCFCFCFTLLVILTIAAVFTGCAQMFDSELLESVKENISIAESGDQVAALSPPTTPFPLNGSTINDATPQLEWEDTEGVAAYQLQLGTDAGLSGQLTVDSDQLTVSQYEFSQAIPNEQTYYWHVRARNNDNAWGDWSDTWSFNLDVGINDPLNPSPAVGSSDGDTTPFLDWEDIVGAVSYDVQVNTTSDFGGEFAVDVSDVSLSQLQVTNVLDDNTSYYWRVRGVNEDGATGSWSTDWYFVVDIPSPSIVDPVDGSSTADTSPLLDWGNADGIVDFMVEISTAEDFSAAIVDEATGISASQYQLSSSVLLDNNTYYWRVRGFNEDGIGGDWSPVFELNVDIAPPVVSFPSDSSKVHVSTPLLQWDAVDSAMDYDIQISSDNSFIGADTESAGGNVYWRVVDALADYTEYYWRCRTTNGDGISGDWSTVSSFNVYLPVAVAGGESYTIATTSDRRVWAWGRNDRGQIGDNTIENRSKPTEITGVSSVNRVFAGSKHSIVLQTWNDIWTWGENGSGQLGDGTETDRWSPVELTSLVGIHDADGGDRHTLARRSNGDVYSWGRNRNGQLGDGTDDDRSTPAVIASLSNVIDVACGFEFSLALQSDGTIMAWGDNTEGQLGINSTSDSWHPVAVHNITTATAIAAGEYHSLALLADGTLMAWGKGSAGQLGNNGTDDQLVPVAVHSLSGISHIDAGSYHSIALGSDGTVYTWGYNIHGQVGDGSTNNRLTPYAVSAVSSVESIAAGGYFSIAIEGDGDMWSWGENASGQLGDESTTNRLIPVKAHWE